MKSLFISLFIGSKEFCNSPLSANTPPCENHASSRAFPFTKFLSTLLLVLLSAGNVWGATVTINLGNSSGKWNIQNTSSVYTDAFSQTWTSTANTDNGASGNQVGSSKIPCTSFVLEMTATKAFLLGIFTLSTEGAGKAYNL